MDKDQKVFAAGWSVVVALLCALVVVAVHTITTLNAKEKECSAIGKVVRGSPDGFICVEE